MTARGMDFTAGLGCFAPEGFFAATAFLPAAGREVPDGLLAGFFATPAGCGAAVRGDDPDDVGNPFIDGRAFFAG